MVKHLSGVAQLLAMKLAERPSKQSIVMGPSEAGWPHALQHLISNACYLYSDFSTYQQDLQRLHKSPLDGVELIFADNATIGARPFERVIVILPKSKDAMRSEFSRATKLTRSGGHVWVVGPNKGGIASASNLLTEFVGPVARKSGARHAKLLEVDTVNSTTVHHGFKNFEVEALGHALQIYSHSGVFSHGHLDVGTEFLLQNYAPTSFQKALDLGCGCGVIGLALKKSNPSGEVDFVDSSAAALTATRQTLRENGLSDERVYASDLFSHVQGRYDLIITNPPFHQGIQTNFHVTNKLLADASRFLKPKGSLVLVANAFIDYLSILRPIYSEVVIRAKSTKFRVIEAKI